MRAETVAQDQGTNGADQKVDPARAAPSRDPSCTVLELRIHGVGGATAQEMLDDTNVVQVAGDELAGFYRGARRLDDREAYAWGKLTTGSIRGLLWVLLVPFALVNIAGFMYPAAPSRGQDHLHSAFVWSIRVFGLVLTAFYAFWALGFAMDDLGRQILGAWCDGSSDPLTDELGRRAGLRMALGAGLVVPGLMFINWVAGHSRQRLEGHHTDSNSHEDPAVAVDFSTRDFWAGHRILADLTWLHNGAALLMIALACDRATLAVSHESIILTGVQASCVAVFAAMALSLLAPASPRRTLSVALFCASALLAAYSMYHLSQVRGPCVEPGRMASWIAPVRWLTGSAMAFLLLACVVAVGHARSTSAALPVLCTLAFAIQSLALGATTMVVQLGLGTTALLRVDDLVLEYPPAYYAGAVTLCLATAGTALVAPLVRRFRSVAWAIGTAVAIGIVAYDINFALGSTPVAAHPAGLMPLGHLALAVVTLVVFVAIINYWQSAATDLELRRSVARVWDVATFWPRWFHPFAPPAYAQKAVPEIAERISRHTSLDRAVIVAAHSQGTVISFAAVQLLGRDRRVALLTFGSPIRRLYATFFPGYFGDESVRTVQSNLGSRWINLFRPSDPIGGKVFSGDDPHDRSICDSLKGPDLAPTAVRDIVAIAHLEGLPWGDQARVAGHSDYELASEYRTAVQDLGNRLNPIAPAGLPTASGRSSTGPDGNAAEAATGTT
jgi:hypothetical protein